MLKDVWFYFDAARTDVFVVFDSHRTQSNRTISLSAVSSTHACELTAGLHLHIHSRFMNILGQSFKPVPSSNEYFYFYNSARRQTAVYCCIVGSYLIALLLLSLLQMFIFIVF